jgi:methylaspartate ammonia-lyase
VSVLLCLDHGQIAHGDCAAVQYATVGGRDAVFDPAEAVRAITERVAPLLVGQATTGFRKLADEVEALRVGGRLLHTAIRYGVSQALLDAVAKTHRVTMAEVIRDEYQTGVALRPVPVFAQSGDDRYDNVDKMILKGVDVLPHGLINSRRAKLGYRGELLADYVRWVRDRILALRPDRDYQPLLHFDVYGTIGEAFAGDPARIADYLAELGEIADPFRLRVEHPLDAGSRDGQIEALSRLRERLQSRDCAVQICVDEWCDTLEEIGMFAAAAAGAADVIHVKAPDPGGVNNTAEALLLVRRFGLAAYCGGTCNETDRSAQVCAHVAMACGADQVLAKPGMGVDEGLMIVANEMARAAALAARRQPPVHQDGRQVG